MSRMLFTPADTTATGVIASSVRSAEMSKRVRCPTVHAADAARGEHADAGQGSEPHGGGDGCRAGGPCGHQPRQVAGGGLVHPAHSCQVVQLLRCEADVASPVEDGDRGGHSTTGADDAFHLRRHVEVLGEGHAVADDRALESDDRHAGGNRLGNLRMDVDGTHRPESRSPRQQTLVEVVSGRPS